MKETVELRLHSEHEMLVTPQSIKKDYGTIKVVELEPQSLDYARVAQAEAQGIHVFSGWRIKRKYSKRELCNAEWVHLDLYTAPTSFAEFGTIYSESSTCPVCGAGGSPVPPLFSDVRAMPKKDIFRTLDGEVVISAKLRNLLASHRLTNCVMYDITHKTTPEHVQVRFERVPSGQMLLHCAVSKGIVPHSTEFTRWINQSPQNELANKAQLEYYDRFVRAPAVTEKEGKYLICPISVGLRIHACTKTGITPFNVDSEGKYRCRKNMSTGHTVGFTLLSELHITRATCPEADMAFTADLLGQRHGLVRPYRSVVVSQKLYELLCKSKISGCRAEVAHAI